MKHVIPARNWTTALADAIESADEYDVIEVHSDAMWELAERARQRMCPDKYLIFEVCLTDEGGEG